MPRIRLHDPMKHAIQQDMMFHAMFADALRQTYAKNWWHRFRTWIGV